MDSSLSLAICWSRCSGTGIDLSLQLLGVLNHVFGGIGLVREAHVHHGSRMAFGGGQVD